MTKPGPRRKRVTSRKKATPKPVRTFREGSFEGPQIDLTFEVDDRHVCIIDREGDRIPLFPGKRVGGRNATPDRLRQAIITIMRDR